MKATNTSITPPRKRTSFNLLLTPNASTTKERKIKPTPIKKIIKLSMTSHLQKEAYFKLFSKKFQEVLVRKVKFFEKFLDNTNIIRIIGVEVLMPSVAIYISDKTYREIQDQMAEKNVGLSEFIQKAVEKYLDQLKRQSPQSETEKKHQSRKVGA